ncbi:uncharacterized protein LOC126858956 isoform X1 [Cataglyphis hispanica]|uniref:uncharacterized protein LOC126858956 isoform X1 n=1 Tax=Cataglyphis hispanica TaxID=1086592 RepID=UPI00218086DD|nr:uncharacterized protein LOC126858956 isoform X1 [Cataglyphis hispanica]
MDTSTINYTFTSTNILMGLKTLDVHYTQNCINIGDLILKSFMSNPNFIGQVDAETEEANTFQEMREKSVKCALWMKRSGILPNDVIMVCTNNQLDAYVPFLAALYIGAVVSPLDQYFVEDNLSYFLEQVKPAMLFIDEKFYMTAFHSKNQLKFFRNIPYPKIIVFPDKNIDLLSRNKSLLTLETILNYNYNLTETELYSCANVTDMTIAMILFTSGTTDFPKCIKISHAAFMAPSDQHAPHMLKNDIALLFESLCFINGIFITIQAILLQVTIIRIKSQFDAGITCKIIEKYKVTWMFLETSMCNQLIKTCEIGKHDVSSLKRVIFSGSTVNSDIIHIGLKALLSDASIFQAYSLTETGIIAYQRHLGKPGSSGHVSPNVQLKISLKILDQERAEGPNVLGEICCMSPYMIDEKLYEFNKKYVSTWIRTGDFGYYDEDHEIFVLERIDQCFSLSLSKSTNEAYLILSTIIERILQRHKAVFEVAVTFIQGSDKDKYPIAFVALMFGQEVTEMELKQFVITNLDCYNMLRNVIFLPHLPHLSNGKINRKLLYDIARSDIFWKRYVLDN